MAGVAFKEEAAARGLTHRWRTQPRPMRNLEAFGTGCAFLDYDNDGWQDILLVDEPHSVLYRNLGNGTFENVTAATGLTAIEGPWKGCAVGDMDGDGWLDLLLTGYHRLVLLRNESGRAWRDVTAEAGLHADNRGHWGSGAGFMDLDGNETLDLVLLNYVIFGPNEKQYCELAPGVLSGCPPQEYRPEFPELWQNEGSGRFREVSKESGFEYTNGKALVLAFADVDDDGRIDFYIGNDGTPAHLMLNLGGLRFRDAGLEGGIAYGIMGHAMAAMCADWGDYDRDGRLDLAVTGFANESYAVFRNLGDGLFLNTIATVGLSGPTRRTLGFGGKWLDVDNDGWVDLSFVNGHVYDTVERHGGGTKFRQVMQLFRNLQGKGFVDLVPLLGGEMAQPILGRGSATGDFDNDGRVDLLAVDYEGAPLLLHNVSTTSHHWVKLDLHAGGSNSFAYGAKVVARAGSHVWVAHVSPASSYLSSSDPRVHFGLGSVDRLDSLTVHWPSREEQSWQNVPADRIVVVRQGQSLHTVSGTRE